MADPVPKPRRGPLSPADDVPHGGSGKSVAREYAEAFAIAIALALVIRTFFVQAYKIPSGSMEPTLLIGDHILVNKLIFGLRMPDSLFGVSPLSGIIPYGQYLFRIEPVHRGDVVVFVFPPDPTKDFIKRVVAVAGDTVEVRDKSVYLNGRKDGGSARLLPAVGRPDQDRAARPLRAGGSAQGQGLRDGRQPRPQL